MELYFVCATSAYCHAWWLGGRLQLDKDSEVSQYEWAGHQSHWAVSQGAVVDSTLGSFVPHKVLVSLSIPHPAFSRLWPRFHNCFKPHGGCGHQVQSTTVLPESTVGSNYMVVTDDTQLYFNCLILVVKL